MQYVAKKSYSVIAICVFVICILMMDTAILIGMKYHSNVSAAIFFSLNSITTIMIIVCNWKILKVIRRHRREIASVERNIDRNNTRFQCETSWYQVTIPLVTFYSFYQVLQIITFFIIVCPAIHISITL